MPRATINYRIAGTASFEGKIVHFIFTRPGYESTIATVKLRQELFVAGFSGVQIETCIPCRKEALCRSASV